MRRVLSIICYCVAGFFVYMVGLLAFISGLSLFGKWAFVGGFTVPGLISMLIGLAIVKFHNWRRSTGIVLLVGTAVNALVVLTLICIFFSAEYKVMFPRNELAFISDFRSGFLFMLVIVAVGGALLRKPRVAS